ncbi:MAG: cation:proton antiporter [Planctomycetota bacterium]
MDSIAPLFAIGGWTLLSDVLVVLSAAFLLGAVLERLGFNALLGYLLAGVLLGPNATGVVTDPRAVEVLAELGVGLLLFSIGLEFSWGRLMATGRRVLWAGVLQVLLTLLLIAGVVMLSGMGLSIGLVIGSSLALSSTASVLRLLISRSELDTVHGRSALGILLVQDISVIPLVLLVDTVTTGGTAMEVVLQLGKTLGFVALLVGGFWVVALKLVPKLLLTRTLSGNRELALLLAAVTGLGSIALAHAVGLSPAVGAFVAGMLLAESDFATQVRADVGGLRTLLVTIFFVSIGMLADPAWIGVHLPMVVGYVVLLIAVKSLLIAAILAAFRIPLRSAIATGLCLAQGGEFAFVLAGQAYPKLIDDDLFQLITAVCVTTLFLTPPLVIGAPRAAQAIVGVLRKVGVVKGLPTAEPDEPLHTDGHVIVVGLGPAATEVVRQLRAAERDVTVVELGGGAVPRGRALGAQVLVGDATYPEVLQHAHVEQAASIVVTVPDAATAALSIRVARSLAPDIRIVARARYSRAKPDLEAAGADVVVDEEHSVGRTLAEVCTTC